MLLAAGVVTWMLFWMRRQSASVKGELQAAVDRALDDGSATALAFLAFVAVIREGIETSLFLVGQMASAQGGRDLGRRRRRSSASAIAVLIGVGFYQGSRRLNLATFFRWTGIALVFIAAGLLSKATHELIEIGVITVGTADALRPERDPAARPGRRQRRRPVPARAVRLHGDAGGDDLRRLADLRGRRPGPVPAAGQAAPVSGRRPPAPPAAGSTAPGS